MTNRITGDRLMDWLRFLRDTQLMERRMMAEALARVVDERRAQIREIQSRSADDRPESR